MNGIVKVFFSGGWWRTRVLLDGTAAPRDRIGELFMTRQSAEYYIHVNHPGLRIVPEEEFDREVRRKWGLPEEPRRMVRFTAQFTPEQMEWLRENGKNKQGIARLLRDLVKEKMKNEERRDKE